MSERPKKTGRRSTIAGAGLRDSMMAGEFAVGGFLPSVRELSRTYRMATETMRRALKTLEAEGYLESVPRQGFRVLRGHGILEKGLAVAYAAYRPNGGRFLWDEFHRTLLAAFQETAAARGWSLLTVNWREGGQEDVLDQVRGARVAGVILDYGEPALLARLQQAGLPAVMVDTWEPAKSVDTVAQDGFVGGYLAATYLAQRGHRRIGWLGADLVADSLQIVERYSGAVGALSKSGLSLAPDLTRSAPLNDPEAARVKALELLDRKDRPTAVLALWQDMTEGVVRAAEQLGLVPGKDFEMVGWSTEEDYARRYLPSFRNGPVPPAITWSIAAMTEAAVRCLVNRRNDPESPATFIRIPVRLRTAKVL